MIRPLPLRRRLLPALAVALLAGALVQGCSSAEADPEEARGAERAQPDPESAPPLPLPRPKLRPEEAQRER